MKTRTPAIAVATLGAAALFTLAVPTAANAHVGVSPSSTAAGSYSVLTFSVGHGCEGSPTTRIAIDIPDAVLSVTPTVNLGWDVERVLDGERTAQVIYTAKTPLPSDLRDTLALSVPLPEDAAGTTLAFPITQTCVEGVTEWNEPTPEGGEEPELPAPSVLVTDAVAGGHHAPADDAADDAAGDAADGDTEATDDDATAHEAAAAPDTLARILGVAGLAVGAVGIVVALAARRRPATATAAPAQDQKPAQDEK